MPTLTFRTAIPATAETVFAWYRRPGAFKRIMPPWERAKMLKATLPFANGTQWTFRGKLFGPFSANCTVEHFDVIEDRQFCYRQLKGPFAKWEHIHRFVPDGENSILENTIEYASPGGILGKTFNSISNKRIERMFDWRHAVTVQDIERHSQFAEQPRLTVVVTGSRGLIGTELVNFLTSGGHRVIRLVTGSVKPAYDDGTTWLPWQPMEPLPPGTLKGVDAVVHLAGENIAEVRWDTATKKRLREGRVIPTLNLAEAVKRDGVPVFLSGSAIGIYGNRGSEKLTENSSTGAGFLAELCNLWEAAARCEARVVHLRTGIVLSPKGGALAKQLPAFRAGGGAVLGSGEQYVSWIGIHDMTYAIHYALMMPELRGPVNFCSPLTETNRVFGRTLAKVLRRPYLLTVPPYALRRLFGELADEGLLASQRARPDLLQIAGYEFARPKLEDELRFLLGRPQ